jgi:hypothetical protein
MQNINELQKNNLELLNLQIAKIEAERDSIQNEMQAIRLLLAQRTSKRLWHPATISTVSVLAVISLSFIFVFHNALSNVSINDQPGESAISVLEPGRIMRGEHQSAQSGKQTTRFASKKAATQLQWGPLLVMPDPANSKRYYGFDPVVKAQQENLLTLGFDVGKADGFKGARTRQAIAEFRALYLPDSARQLQDADLAAIMDNYANLARSDAARFGIDQGVVAAIRLSSVRTGVDFSYLMKLAATESNFEPASEAATSSATGLYQFTRDTWLNALKMYGAKYGLVADYAANIEYSKTRSGYQRPFVRDQALYKHLLALRKNPRISAMMAAETVHDNQQKLAQLFNRAPTETDLYLTHFLGADEAITFLRSLQHSPDMHAMELFPEAASSNRNIFHPQTSEPRTVDEVYALFGEKFTTSRYDDLGAN